jgi:acyl-CoA reductase-like NAD-dependent aldehyde dehydrogenase
LSLDEILPYLERSTEAVAVFFPLNLPVYTYTLFAVIPSFIARDVFIRPPQRMMELFRNLMPLLNTEIFFPNIRICFESREDFVESYVTTANVTVFTGQEKNARLILKRARKGGLFLFNGFGWNPIVANPVADLQVTVSKTVEAKLFNSGQDCAGPDTILVHQDIANQFVDMLKDKLSLVMSGEYTDPDVTVGRIMEESQLGHLSAFLLKHQSLIVYGGCVDYRKGIVQPTLIVSFLADQTSFKELFSPIFSGGIFKDDQQLAKYFDSPQYAANSMYVSVFGSSTYVDHLERSIIIRNQTILDVERGNNEYGGMSVGASFASSHGKIEARPLLAPREISDYLAREAERTNVISSRLQKRICEEVKQAIIRCFGSNLVAGFVFGSMAKGYIDKDVKLTWETWKTKIVCVSIRIDNIKRRSV